MFKVLRVDKYTQELIEEYYKEAFQYLDQINTDNKEQLLFFIKKLIKRVQ